MDPEIGKGQRWAGSSKCRAPILSRE